MSPRMSPRRSSHLPLLAGDGPLARVRPVVVFVVVLAVFGIGVWLRGPIGAGLLLLLCVGVIVLLTATWSVLRPAERALRVAVVAILALVALSILR